MSPECRTSFRLCRQCVPGLVLVSYIAKECIKRTENTLDDDIRQRTVQVTDVFSAADLRSDKQLSCRRETARCFVSLNISLNHSRSLNVIRNGTIRKLGYVFQFAFHSNYGSILYHFRDKARYWSKIAILSYPCIPRPVMWSRRKRHISFGMEN